jgi:hypothetical protein
VSLVNSKRRFQFEQDAVVNKDIRFEITNSMTTKPNWYFDPSDSSQAGLIQRDDERFLINRFEKTKPQLVVNLKKGTNRLSRNNPRT